MKKLLVLLCVMAACGRGPGVEAGTIASAGGRKIDLREFEEFLQAQLGPEPYHHAPEVLSGMVDAFVKEDLLAAEAGRRGFGSGDRDKAIRHMMAEECAALPQPGADAVRTYYDRHAGDFATPPMVQFREIFVVKPETAAKVQSELRAGGDFAVVAKKYSETANQETGGQVGPLAFEDIPEELALALKNLRPGQVSGLLPVAGGTMVLKLERVLPPQSATMEQAGDVIRAHLAEEACQARMEQLEQELVLKEHIWIYPENLPFAYAGELPVYSRS